MNILKATILLPILLAGCVSFSPVPEGYSGPVATIKDSSQSPSNTKTYFFQLSKADGRAIETSSMVTFEQNYGQGMSMTPYSTEREIPAGDSSLTIEGITHFAAPILALKGGNYSVRGDVSVNLRENETYIVSGSMSKEYSAVWLEDMQGNIISEKIEKIK